MRASKMDLLGLRTSVVAAAHAVAFDAGLASILLAIDDRHAFQKLRPIAVVAPGCGQPSGVQWSCTRQGRQTATATAACSKLQQAGQRKKRKEDRKNIAMQQFSKGISQWQEQRPGAGWLAGRDREHRKDAEDRVESGERRAKSGEWRERLGGEVLEEEETEHRAVRRWP